MLPSEIISPLRSLKDFIQQFSESVERSSGASLDAKIYDQTFIVKEHVIGLHAPTTMTFIDNDILVLEKKQIFTSWIVILSITTFTLSMCGTFLVRSGILNSVHTFANDPERGLFILVFLFMSI